MGIVGPKSHIMGKKFAINSMETNVVPFEHKCKMYKRSGHLLISYHPQTANTFEQSHSAGDKNKQNTAV